MSCRRSGISSRPRWKVPPRTSSVARPPSNSVGRLRYGGCAWWPCSDRLLTKLTSERPCSTCGACAAAWSTISNPRRAERYSATKVDALRWLLRRILSPESKSWYASIYLQSSSKQRRKKSRISHVNTPCHRVFLSLRMWTSAIVPLTRATCRVF